MDLKKQPKTEAEYWAAIEGLGGFIWHTKHGIAHGHIPNPDGAADKEITEAQELLERIIAKLPEKFGVILPKDCPKTEPGQEPPSAPEGKIYYWDWYKKMKTESYRLEYEGIICSACPFSKGLEKFLAGSGRVPCGALHGMLSSLRAPHICGMITYSDWTEKSLFEKIIAQPDGENSLAAFMEKVKILKSATRKTK